MLPWAELWYNSSFHSSLGASPYKVLYGREATEIPHYNSGDSQVPAVDAELQLREETLEEIKKNLVKAQARMKRIANKKRTEISFEEGDWVFVQLKPYRQISVAHRLHNKFCKIFFGPYKICKKVNQVAYKLELPEGSKIHSTFHVSKLRKLYGPIPENPIDDQPIITANNKPIIYPTAILDERKIIQGEKAKKQILVMWNGAFPEDTSWEFEEDMAELFPAFNIEDNVGSQGRGDDTILNTSERPPEHVGYESLREDVAKIEQAAGDLSSEFGEEEPEQLNCSQPGSTMRTRSKREKKKPNWTRDFCLD